MKKRISVIITFILLLLLAFSLSASAYSTGDIDGNGKHTAADARLVLRYSAKLEKLNAEQLKVADVDYNGKVTASDARYILRVSAKLDKPFGEIDTAKHILLRNRKKGGCQSLKGKITPVVIFVNDPVNKWDDNEKKTMMNDCSEVIKEIQRQAALFGQNPVIKPVYKTATIKCNVKDEGWDTLALKSAGLPSDGIVNDAIEKQYGVNEAPVIFVANFNGRAHAVSGAGREYVVLYDSMDGMFHELCHVFGAPDYYYPELVNKIAQEVFPDSIMLSGKTVDDVTAYNIGWTDKISETATEFLKKTAYVTEKDINESLEKQWVSGNVTDWVTGQGVYSGYMKDGIFEGQGSIKYNDGGMYSGNWKNGRYHGYGVFTSKDGSVYDGYWTDGKQNGQGKLTYTDGSVYSGNWLDAKRDGYGVLTYSSGAVYDGYWKNDSFDGYGVFTYSDGGIYDGYWTDGKKNGQGKIIHADGSGYDGNWKYDKYDGYGVLKYSDGSAYDGYWTDGKQNGQGMLTYADGSVYSGNWLDAKRDGYGVLTYSSGTKYDGYWKNDSFDGYGVYYFANGDVFQGNWVNGVQHGNGIYIFSNGSSVSGIWQNGNHIG